MIRYGFILFLVGNLIFAQKSFSQDYFSLRYDFTNNSDIGGGIITVDSGYYVFNVNIINQYNSKIGLTFIDSFGNVIWQKSYGKQGLYFSSGRFGQPLVLSNDKTKLFFAGTVIDSSNRYFATLWSFNRQGDSLWCKYYGDSTSFYSGNFCAVTNDSSIIIAGAMNNGTTQAMLIKTDSLGNKLWEQNYGGGGAEYGCSVLQTPDNGYMMGITTTSFGGDVDMAVIKTNSSGTQQLLQPYTGNFSEADISYLISLSDGNFALCGALGSSTSNFFWPRIIKLNSSGGVIWDKKYSNLSWSSGFCGIIEEPNTNNIVGCGIANKKGLVLKVNSNGDSLWKRSMNHPSVINPLSTNILWALDTAINGGYVCAGVIYPSTPDTGSTDVWVIKVDEWGCDTLGCQFVSVEENEVKNGLIGFYPNPATSEVYLEFDETFLKGGEITIKMYDISGKIIISKQVEYNNESIDLSKFSTGVYFLTITNGDIITERIKLMKK